MENIFGILSIIWLVVILMIPLYDKYIAPRYKTKVTIRGKGFTTGTRPVHNNIHRASRPCNYYWGEFQVIETGDIMELKMGLDLYIAIQKGQRGILTYRKGYALSFQKMGTIKRRKLSRGERALDYFQRFR